MTQAGWLAADAWVWPQGCIEQVTGADDKGEDAIIEQEQRLRDMNAAEIDQPPAATQIPPSVAT